MKPQVIGEHLRVLREDAGYTQQEIGRELGMTQAGYAYLESGNREIKMTTYFDAIQAIGKTPEEAINHLLSMHRSLL